MFDEFRELVRGIIATSVASLNVAQEHHKDALAHTEISEGMRRADLALQERITVAQERAAAAWERVASALEQLAHKA